MFEPDQSLTVPRGRDRAEPLDVMRSGFGPLDGNERLQLCQQEQAVDHVDDRPPKGVRSGRERTQLW